MYAVMTVLALLGALALVLGGVWLFRNHHDFYTAFWHQLDRGIYRSALLVLVFSSVLYTPFSYGVSHYFLQAAKGPARFSAVFFLFGRPRLLIKATVLSVVKKGLIYLERLVVLLVGALVQVVLFFGFLIFTGQNVFAVEGNPFESAAAFMFQTPGLITLSVLLWCGMLVLFFLIYLRYVLCKYVLLLYPEVSVFQALKVGKGAIAGNIGRTLLFYWGYGAFCLLNLLSFGLYARRGSRRPCGFSAYAGQLVRLGWSNYCRKRSLR